MAFDIIIFTQHELDNAISAGHKSIGLCDNTFVLPLTTGICYTAIGEVSAAISLSETEFETADIVCDGFTPKFLPSTHTVMVIPSKSTSAVSASSYITSYFMSSYFMTSYRYKYEYGSFTSSYTTSYTSSFSTSMSSLSTSFLQENEERCVLVNGFGINLI